MNHSHLVNFVRLFPLIPPTVRFSRFLPIGSETRLVHKRPSSRFAIADLDRSEADPLFGGVVVLGVKGFTAEGAGFGNFSGHAPLGTDGLRI